MVYRDLEKKKARDRRYYDSHKEQRREYNAGRQQRIREFVIRVKRLHPCIDCGEHDPCCLEFHHVKGKKMFAIAHASYRGLSMKKIKSEMRKCIIICANCHRKRHSEDRKKGRDT